MGTYTPGNGFEPSTNEENINKLKDFAKIQLDLDVASEEDFQLSNFWLVYYAVSLMKEEIDYSIVKTIDTITQSFKDEYGSLEPKNGTSFLGLQNILKQCSDDFEIETYHNNSKILPAECRIALKNENEELLSSLIKSWFDFSTKTNPSALPCPKKSININILDNQFTFYYEKSFNTNLEIDIKYQTLDTYISQGGEDDIIKKAFINKWNSWQKLGKDFEPEVYLSNDVCPFISSYQIGYKKKTDKDFTFAKIEHQFAEVFTLLKKDGLPLITVEKTA